MPEDDSTLAIARLIPAPPAVVWRAWSQPEHLAQWWIPKPIECRVVKLDLRPGGGFETRMREGDGEFQPHLDACFLEIVPERRLVFTTVLTEGWQPVEPWLALTAIISLEASGAGTRYSARVLHRSPEDSRKHADLGFEAGWDAVLDQLAAYVPTLV
ncbi:SRPBCC family protein [Tabrizicola oligotrophica]|uniref:SRPBCC family protein n=1 Tax=Tabrizicola oligotrophica TaxID=2710650 RepID=A0A6M0QST1_9RHOB|nr:SRPBCC family protein [Tabrizicola oligotrophica]NEY90061.1 SRPBCC family protein [Tabrizicola oligotrophica]